jgi:hypothetical protein
LKDGTSLSDAGMKDLIADVREQKVLDRYQFFKLASIEDQLASIQFGQDEGVVSGRTVLPTRSAGSRGGFRAPTGSTGSRGFGTSAQGAGPAGGSSSSARRAGSRGGFRPPTPSAGSGGRFGSSARSNNTSGFGRIVSNTYQMRQTGSHVQVVSRVRDDGKIVVKLSVASSRLKPAPVPQSEESDESQPSTDDITPPSMDVIQCNTSVLLEPGVHNVIAAEGEGSDAEASRAYIIVSATVK